MLTPACAHFFGAHVVAVVVVEEVEEVEWCGKSIVS
jgi:hypothetical protein